MGRRPIVVGASAGGVEALRAVVAGRHGHARSAEVYGQRTARTEAQAQQLPDLVENAWSDEERDGAPTGG